MMEVGDDDSVYVLANTLLESEDHMLVSHDDFSDRKRKHIYTLDGMQELEEEILVAEDADDILAKRIKTEVPGVLLEGDECSNNAGSLPEAANFLLPDDPPQNMDYLSNSAKDEKADNILVEHIDIRAPISTLRTLLEKRLNVDLSDFEFWLQNAQKLEPEKNLVDQCIQGKGLVQINIELTVSDTHRRINIVDVLKPTDEFLEAYKQKNAKKPGMQWVVDHNFKKELSKLHIPDDPRKWTREQVKLWIVWAVRQFNLVGMKLSDWFITGKELCDMTFDTFKEKCKRDRGGIFWTHLELLRRCGFLAVLAKPEHKVPTEVEEEEEETELVEVPTPHQTALATIEQRSIRDTPKKSRILGSNSVVNERRTGGGSYKSGNNGQIQLWQFLLELLTDKAHRSVIYWVSDDGEFKLENPEVVANLWGIRKNKPQMTYEKLSRALRYYYDGDMIAKVQGKRFVYKFVCDLKELLGYSASQLNALVAECVKKHGLPSAGPTYFEHPL